MGLLTQNKYCAVVNIFADYENTEIELRKLGAIDLRQYYERHWKRYQRFVLRQKILAEKKKKKVELMAQLEGIDAEQIDADSVEVSDVSDRDLGSGFSSMTEAEDFIEMLSDNQANQSEGFLNLASKDIDLGDFVPATELRYQEEVISEKSYYEFYQEQSNVNVEFIEQNKLDFPEILKVYTFGRGKIADYPKPQRNNSLGVYNYYLLDGASLLPVLALEIQPNDVVGDFCAAPGGKALMIMLTMRPKSLRCNDSSLSRSVRLKSVFACYIPKISNLHEIVKFTSVDARSILEQNVYDKILVDVPCTNDRVSVLENNNNIFKASRNKERMELPQSQMDILYAGLLSLKVNGYLVYSTCSLSPIQNDGVVHMALKRIWEETNYEFAVCNLREAFRPLRGLYRMYHKFKYGTQVLPFIPSNFGPMYICKLKRIK